MKPASLLKGIVIILMLLVFAVLIAPKAIDFINDYIESEEEIEQIEREEAEEINARRKQALKEHYKYD